MNNESTNKAFYYANFPLIGLGLAEIVIGAIVYNYTENIKVGAW